MMKTFMTNWVWWERKKAFVERIVTNTSYEPIVRWLWREMRSISRPHRRAGCTSSKYLRQIISRVVEKSSNCVDIGSNKGHVLWYMLQAAPKGHHFAFEPIPELAQFVQERFMNKNVDVYELALSDFTGESPFFRLIIQHGRSGFRRQRYPRPEKDVEEITVKVETLDNILPKDSHIHFIKVDVEGAELSVFRGAIRTIQKYKPFIVFEHGSQLAATYGVTPETVYELLVDECAMNIALTSDWLARKAPLSRQAFIEKASISHDDFLAYP